MKKLFCLLFVALLLVVPTTALAADKAPVNVYLFHGSTCPHCQELIEWFGTQEEEYGDLYELVKYEVWEDEKNAELMTLTGQYMNYDVTGVPFMIIGEKVFSGFSAESDPEEIIAEIKSEYEKDPEDRANIVDKVIKENNWVHDTKEPDKTVTNLIIGIVSIIVIVGFIIIIKKARED